jgi:hypothetical protein
VRWASGCSCADCGALSAAVLAARGLAATVSAAAAAAAAVAAARTARGAAIATRRATWRRPGACACAALRARRWLRRPELRRDEAPVPALCALRHTTRRRLQDVQDVRRRAARGRRSTCPPRHSVMPHALNLASLTHAPRACAGCGARYCSTRGSARKRGAPCPTAGNSRCAAAECPWGPGAAPVRTRVGRCRRLYRAR